MTSLATVRVSSPVSADVLDQVIGAWLHTRATQAGAAQVAQVRRTVTRKGEKTVEVVYLITSDRDADPATLAAWVRGHWEIVNRLHWAARRDLSGG